MSSFRLNVCVVVYGNYLYVIGGTSVRFEYLSIVERFDFKRNVWENFFLFFIGRLFVFGIVVKGKVFVFGGFRLFFRDGDLCEVYDLEINMWSGIFSNVVFRSYVSVANFING